jgi:hypothetical protein
MWALLLVLIVLLFVFNKAREHFGLVVGKGDWGFTTDTDTNDGYEVFSTYPYTCPKNKPELDAGLCYERCRSGFRGVGPVCWAETQSVGVGVPIGLEPCPDRWVNDGLICREPITNDCSWKGLFGECWGKLQGGKLKGRLDGGGICDWPQDRSKLPGWLADGEHPERVDGLCYRKCPTDKKERVPGMPYLCYKGGPLSYGRGVGVVPGLFRIGRVWSPF